MRIARIAIVLALAQASAALWPFKHKRFSYESLVNAGALGLDDVQGRVIAIGDVDGDQNSDLFVLSADAKSVLVYVWDRDAWHYKLGPTLTFPKQVTNVIPTDINADGRLDLLVMMYDTADGGWWGGHGKPRTDMTVVLSGEGGFGTGDRYDILHSTGAQPLLFDFEGSLRPSLLGLRDTDEGPTLSTWFNNGTGFVTHYPPPLYPDQQACTFADVHSSAYIDLNGDCAPDLVLHCSASRANQYNMQIWTNGGENGYILSKGYNLPFGSRMLSFADMDRDGSMDMVFATCNKHYPSNGVGTDCTINIAYNRQVGTCSTQDSQFHKSGLLKCRGYGDLCRADQSFEFDFDVKSPYFTSIPVQELFPDADVKMLVTAPNNRQVPLPIRPGDFDVDGFPDLLFIIKSKAGNQVKVLRNVPCRKGVAGCDADGHGVRGFVVAGGKGWEALEEITDAVGASWLDIDDDGSLDIMVQRTGRQDGQRVTFIQNNFYHDAFFLKAQVLNGACDRKCEPPQGGKKYSGLGASYSGATFKFTVFDTAGRRHAQQVAQLAQTGYQALHSPHTFIGLGRTNNYVENLMVGTSLYPPLRTTMLESLIPNSQVIINPPWPESPEDKKIRPVKARSREWRSELFLHPGDWIPWVGVAVAGTVVILGAVVMWLGDREKKEDEKERRRALHAINFQAL